MFHAGSQLMIPTTLRRVLPILQCPSCRASTWSVTALADATANVTCLDCNHPHAYERGILWINLPTESVDVIREREAVRPTEQVPELGGWNARYTDPESIDPELRSAYLALPYGNASAHFTEPGYFANVSRLAAEFDFVVDHLPNCGLLLDIGADGTWSTARLSARGLTCVALDITNHLVLGELYQTVYPPYARVNVDMHARVFRDESFEVVTAFNSLHHSKHLEAVAGRIASILKPDGLLGFVEPYVQNATQEAAFGSPQSAIGISENVHDLSEWHRAFASAGQSLVTFALSDSFNAVYRKSPASNHGNEEQLRTDADGCLVHYYQSVIEVSPTRISLAKGDTARFLVSVRNAGDAAAWATRGPLPVALGYHLSKLDGEVARMVAFDNERTTIRRFLSPGRTESFDIEIRLPESGTYSIEFDLVQETRSWFKDRGGRTATASCVVAD